MRRFFPGLALTWILAAVPAQGARFDLPIRHAGENVPAPALLGDQFVVRLRPDVAYAAFAQLDRRPDRERMEAQRVPALATLASRLGGARLEAEFPGLRPEEWGSELSSFFIVRLPRGGQIESALPLAEGLPEVVEAFPMTVVPLEDTEALGASVAAGNGTSVAAPDDSLWGLCWWLRQNSRRDIHALEAWDITQGDDSTVVAVLDTGVLSWHPDLGGTVAGDPGRMWVNRAERDGLPGVDDDHNGFIDDVYGWDFVSVDSSSVRTGEDWRDEDNDPSDFAIHGTAVSGVVAAIVNNGIGVAGVAPHARIMPLRVGYSGVVIPSGEIGLTWVARAMYYASRNGATVVNCSFSNPPQPDLIAAANALLWARVTLVASAGNCGTQSCAHYLADRDDAIAVAATDQFDRLLNFSSRGPYVDLSAPGVAIAVLTLHATGTDSIGYRTPFYSPSEAGTSFSAPMVAGAVALLQAQRRAQGLPPLHPYNVQLRIKETTDDITSANAGNSGWGTGRLNLLRMLTDPQRSIGFDQALPTMGAGIPLRTQAGRPWMAHVSMDSMLRITDISTGKVVASAALGAAPVGGLASADFGEPIGTALVVGLQDGRLAAFDLNCRPLPGWPVDATTTRGVPDAMASIGDIDGDGTPEVVWGGDDGSVWAWHVDGRRVTGFPRRLGNAAFNLRIALGNLDGSPGLEIIAVTQNFAMHALKGDGTSLPNWPVYVGSSPTTPVISRLDRNDGGEVVLVAAGLGLRAYNSDGSLRFASILPSVVSQDLAVGDLDGDGKDEIVVASTGPDELTVLDSKGSLYNQRSPGTLISGPPFIGPLAPGTGAQIVFSNRDNTGRTRLVAWGAPALPADMPDLPGWPKAGHPGTVVSMLDVDGDGATELLAGSGADSLNYVYDAGPGSWRPNAVGWPTPRGNFARTGNRIDAPGNAVIDDVAPEAVQDLSTSAPTTHQITLRWTAPADPGTSTPVSLYDVRFATAPITAGNFDQAAPVADAPVPAVAGTPQEMSAASLPESRDLWFAMRARDAHGNWSAISNVIEASTAADPPAPVADLRPVAGSDSSVTLSWTATGDDGRLGRPAFYRLRWSDAPLDSAAFETAPSGIDVPARAAAGQLEQVVVRGLDRGRRYWIAMRAVDAAGNVSALSNEVAPVIGRLAAQSGIALLPSRVPSRSPVQIEWQGVAEFRDGPQFIQIFDIHGRRLSTLPLTGATGGITQWDGRDGVGTWVGPGVYFARLTSGPFHSQARIVLLR